MIFLLKLKLYSSVVVIIHEIIIIIIIMKIVHNSVYDIC